MKKVGLITYYGENYGGMLQAYALQRYVNDLGYECNLISNDFLYMCSRTSKNKIFAKKMKALILHPLSYLSKRRVMRKYAYERALKRESFQRFLNANLKIDDTGYTTYTQYKEMPPTYDVYLCGSDQIWNPNLYHENGFYFADFAPEDALKISYASSIGVSSVTKEQADFMKPFLDKLDIISTREVEGSKIVEELTGKKVRTVLDPTLLLNEEEWASVASQPPVEGRYIFIYLFGEREYIEKVKSEVKQITGLETVCIPYVKRELESGDRKIFDAGPAEFISLIKNAALVVTDSFHATAFSINLKTPFLSLCRFSKSDSKGMNSRLTTILDVVGLSDRLIDENDIITPEMLFDIDFTKVHEKLNEQRRIDGTFLKESLEFPEG